MNEENVKTPSCVCNPKISFENIFPIMSTILRANYRLKKRNQEWNVLSIVRELLIVLTRTKKLNRDFIGMHQYKIIVKTKEYMKIASRQLILIFIMSVFRYVYISTCVTCFLALRKDYFQLHQTYVYFVLVNSESTMTSTFMFWDKSEC